MEAINNYMKQRYMTSPKLLKATLSGLEERDSSEYQQIKTESRLHVTTLTIRTRTNSDSGEHKRRRDRIRATTQHV